MPAKRFLLIILCILLAVMVVLFAVIGSRFAPLLSMLGGLGGSSTTPPPVSTVQPTTTTAPTQGTTAPPETQPPTQAPTEPPTTAPTEPPHVHSYSPSKVVKPGCGTVGYTVYNCDCGKVEIRDIIEGTDHVFDGGTIVEATCEERGYTEYICTGCGFSSKQDFTEPLGHNYELVESYELSCDQDAYDLYRCTHCEDEKKENEVIAPGHDCSDWTETKAPGPNEPGEEIGICATCGETVTRPCALRIYARYKAAHENFLSYTVYVGTSNTPKALEYIVHDYSQGNIRFEYREDGLAVFLNDVELTTMAAYQNVTLTIDADGNIVGSEAPQPSEPSEPTEPVEPSEPSEPVLPPEEDDETEE